MSIKQALTIVAVHNHPHYKTPAERILLEEALAVLREYADTIERKRFGSVG